MLNIIKIANLGGENQTNQSNLTCTSFQMFP